jgi:DNA polymerase sigma
MTLTPENQSGNSAAQRLGDRGGRGRGRGRGGAKRGGGRRGTTDNSNRTRRGKGGGGRSGPQQRVDQDRDSPSDEVRKRFCLRNMYLVIFYIYFIMLSILMLQDVMIEFMHLMRSGDEQARLVFEEFGNPNGPSGQRNFVKQVRKLLSDRLQNKEQEQVSKIKDSENVDNNEATVIVHDVRSVEGTMIHNARNVRQSYEKAGPGNLHEDSSSKGSDFEHIMAKLTVKSKSEKNIDHDSDAKSMNPNNTWPTAAPDNTKQTLPSPPPGLGPIYVSPSPAQNLRDSSNSNIPVTTISEPELIPTASTTQLESKEKGADDSNESTKPKTNAPLKWQPKRFLTRIEEQPGKLLVNNQQATLSGYPQLTISTKKEFVATWSLPLQYLQQRTLRKLQAKREQALEAVAAAETEEERNNLIASIKSPGNLTIRDALQSLTVGLYRRGCQENGSSHSIISKQVVPSAPDANDSSSSQQSHEYQFEINHQTGIIYGTVPFYTPRTPGNVVLRLYFEEDASITLATSTCIKVIVTHDDLEQTLRFILSNFKSRKGSTSASISCINSFANVLEQLQPDTKQQYRRYNNISMDGSGRATWGCICESRKIVDIFRIEHSDKKETLEKQLAELESQLEALENVCSENMEVNEKEVGGEADKNYETQDSTEESPEGQSKNDQSLKDLKVKKGSLMLQLASNERKWRDVQGAFATVLSAIIHNPASTTLLKHDIVMKLRLEYELWCDLCESFAPNPFEVIGEHDHEVKINYPHPITNAHINRCKQSCSKMQKEILGYKPKRTSFVSLEHSSESKQNRTALVTNLSNAMENLFNKEYVPTTETYQKKNRARDLTQTAVSMCDKFPPGTKVVIFGSSANGFGSPTSDLDMCLQLPPTASAKSFEGENGAIAMAALVEKLNEIGMKSVDDARLTARIPVIKFYCPNTDNIAEEKNDDMIECDISMQNPLAVINTALLFNYSILRPEVRILVAIIKRWAKNRDINEPSNHTLSSYGYIIMLLHFLTTHKGTDKSIEPLYQLNENGKYEIVGRPLLPNLQWMHPNWANSPLGSSYQEIDSQPKNQYTMMPHPSESSFMVNKYYFQLSDEATLANLRRQLNHEGQHHGNRSQDRPLVGRILASFYHYYAYEFDYKKHVVSLQSHRYGTIEREAKGENDGWKCFGQSLSIEDPFERFYDIAHVLKPSSFQRIRREFALAYTKIIESFQAAGGSGEDFNDFGKKLIDAICES